MDSSIDRRGFFRRVAGAHSPQAPVQRPPWSRPESAFAAVCDGCGDCIRACPEAILVPSRGGLPRIDFGRGGCSFCSACASACARAAFEAAGEPWDLVARISTACLEPQGTACRVCESACDTAALRFRPMLGGRAQVIVSAERCTGCGACVRACPVQAITVAAPEPHQKPAESAA